MPNFIKNASYRSISIETKGYGGPQPTCLGDLKCPQLNNQIIDAPFGSSNSRDILIGKFQLPICRHGREKKNSIRQPRIQNTARQCTNSSSRSYARWPTSDARPNPLDERSMRSFQLPRRRLEAERDPRSRTCYEEQQHKLLQEKMESHTWWCGNEDRDGGSSPGARSGLVLWSSTLRTAAQVRRGNLHRDSRNKGLVQIPFGCFLGNFIAKKCVSIG